MKKHLLRSLFFIAALVMGAGSAWAETGNAVVKATYISGSDADVDKSFGEIAAGEAVLCGYNKISGGEVALANKAWGVNNIAYLQVDASAIEGTITGATLSVDCQQISARGLNYGVGYNTSTWSNTLTWNTADRTITTMGSVVSGSKTTADKHIDFDIKDAFKNDADKIVTILVYQTAAGGGYIKNPTVTIEYTNAAVANYTVKFMCGETEIKDAVIRTGIVGEKVTLENGDDAAVYANDKKYIYTGSNINEVTIANDGTSVIIVNFREAATYNYALVNNLGGNIATGSNFEGENVSVAYPRYTIADSKLYEADPINKEYRKTITLTADNVSATVEYKEKTGVNAVFCSEGENVEGMTASTSGNLPIRGSNAQGGVSTEDVTITTLPVGKYVLHVGTFTSKTSEQKIYIGYGETQIAFASSGNLNETASTEIVLEKETAIKYFGTTSSADAQFDYIWIEKTGDVELPTEVTIDMTGAITDGESYYATFSNAKALDFTGVEGLTAYTGVKTDNVFLTLEEVTKVPANTGLFIKTTEAKTYTIPFAEGEVEAPAANDLIAAVDVVNSSTVTNAYKLEGYDESYMGKYVYFRSIGAATDIPAGTAYLSLTDSEDEVAYGYVYVKFPAGPAAEVANIAALKAQDAENVTLTLNNTKITYANESYIVIEDATGGALLSLDALDDMLKSMMPMYAGYTFNGTLGLAFDPMVSLYGVADLSGMEVNTTAPAEPLAITAENVNAYTESYDWRWVKFAGATWTKETQSLNIKELEMDIPVQDLLSTGVTMPEVDATVDVEGYVYLLDLSIYGLGTAIYFQPTKVTEVKDEPQTEERNWIIFEEIVEKDALAADAQFTNKAGDLVLTITDPDNKMSIDANNAYFGTAEKQDKFTHRLKTGGKSSSKNSMTLTIPGKGTLKVYARTGSNSATDRNVVLTQNGTELYNKVVVESDAIEVEMGGETPTMVYPVISVAVVAGQVNITYPVNSINFYGFEFIDETETGITTVNTEVKAAEGVYNLRGQKVENMVKGQLYIINGKKVMIK